MIRQPVRLTDAEYEKLLAVRVGIRRFLRWSEKRAAAVGLTAGQHQLLLAVRGHPDPSGPSIGDVAEYLGVRHHSAVQLIDRVEQLGLVRRGRSKGHDRRVVRLRLTAAGDKKLALLAGIHLEELQRVGKLIEGLADHTRLEQA
jgi:DNA-binding MarR family transcriptional regulator